MSTDAHDHRHDHRHDHQHGDQHDGPAHGHGHGHGTSITDDEESLGELAGQLDLDAAVLAPYLADVLDAVRDAVADVPVRAVLDLGAGTGTGTAGLAARFPDATVHAVDRWETMLARVRDRAAAAGIDGRVRTVRADVGTAWPTLEGTGTGTDGALEGALDVVWASLVLHEVGEPQRVLRDAHAALRPGGVLAVVEMDGLPRFLPADRGTGRPDLEERCHTALRSGEHGVRSDHGIDWTPALRAAGFTEVDERRFALRAQPGSDLPRHARGYLQLVRPTVAGRLAPDDLAALDALLDEDGPASVLRRTDLELRGARTVWLARR